MSGTDENPSGRSWDDEREAAFAKAMELNGKPCSVFRTGKTMSAWRISDSAG